MSAQFVTSELDLNDLSPYPLTKESACALQQELRDQFSTASFQARLREVEDVCNPASTEFKKLQQELVFDVQRQIIPKYGFQASLDGVGEMRLAFKRQFSDDQEVSANTDAINRLIAKTSDPESEVERAAILELTRERALSLQEELRTAFSGANFQSKLSLAESAHGHGTLEFKKVQQELVLNVQKQIIPKYGYWPSVAGVADMRLAFKRFSDDLQVNANIKTINRLIGQIKDDKGDEERALAIRDVATKDSGLQLSLAIQPFAQTVPNKPSGIKEGSPGVEIDMNAIDMPLTLRQALDLQHALRLGFSKGNFQLQLWECEEKFGYDSLQFKKVQQELIRSVQRQVLPDFGYEPSDEGVAEMRRDVNAFSDASAEVSANIEAINKLIGKIPDPEIRAEFREAQLTKFKPPVLVAKESDNYQVVTGDGFRGGILVRLGEGVTSLAHRQPLSKGAIVRVLVTIGNRANFEKVSGEGPNYGWVSLHVRNKPLMQKYVGKIVLERQLKYLAIVDAPIVQQKVPAIEDKPTLAAIEDVPSTLALVVEEEKPVELKRDEALSLQNELRSAFSTRSFQERLQQCIEELIPPSLPFRKAQHELIFEVQKRILPKWGFKASLEGVADMRKAVQKHNHNYPPISANIAIINRLIGK
mmetsp:Transcript_42335/g.75858  ORF Transcript_42335/g.75858 Transcript_42335/m.75858 type:complete len:646 (-) Transcript_42335:186-2123(-)